MFQRSGGIRHLVGKQSRVSRVDGMGADQMNAVFERITGAQHPAYTEAAPRQAPAPQPMDESLASAVSGAPTQGTPLQQTMGMQHQPPQLHEMAARIQFLEQRLAQYETNASYNPDRASNHGYNSTVHSRDMDPKKKKRKDPADGKASWENDKQEDAMSTLRELGVETMQEWRELAGLPEVSSHAYQATMNESYEDVYEDGGGTLWESFLARKNISIDEFDAFMAEVEQTKNPQDLDLLRSLDEEFQVYSASFELTESTEPEGEETWESFLESNGIAVDDFDALCDEAIRTGNDAMMDDLLALQDMFEMKTRSGAPVADKPNVSARVAAMRSGAPLRSAPKPPAKVKRIAGKSPAAGKGGTVDWGKWGGQEKFRSKVGEEDDTIRNYNKARIFETDMTEFEADAEPDGSPKIPWKRVLKAFKVKMAASDPGVQAGKDEGGFGGMSRKGF